MKTTKVFLSLAVTFFVGGCQSNEPGVVPSTPWCGTGGVDCQPSELRGLFKRRPSNADKLRLCVNVNKSKNLYKLFPFPPGDTLSVDLPKVGTLPVVPDLEVLAIRDNGTAMDAASEDLVCRQAACVAAKYYTAMPTVDTSMPNNWWIPAPLTFERPRIKLYVDPQEAGTVSGSYLNPEGTQGAFNCRHTADNDQKACSAEVEACTDVALDQKPDAGGAFINWGTGNDYGCQSNPNPYRLVAGQRPGSKLDGAVVEPFCSVGPFQNTITAKFVAGRCQNGTPGGACTLCNPIDSIDPGVGTRICNAEGKLECGNIQRQERTLDGNSPWLQHECGAEDSEHKGWTKYFSRGDMPCTLQTGPNMSLPPGRYSLTVSGILRYASRVYVRLEVVNKNTGETFSHDSETESGRRNFSISKNFYTTNPCDKFSFLVKVQPIDSDEIVTLTKTSITPLP